jgi:hypothetical protein
MGVCYAVSKDGVSWDKPSLEVYPWEGARSNILLRGPHGAGIFRDSVETNPERRYKLMAKTGEGAERPLAVAFSPDGLRFGALHPILEDVRADTHNNALWVPELEKYVGFTRQWPDNERAICRIESPNFLDWTRPVEVLRGTNTRQQVYSMPVFRYRNIYLGLPSIFDTRTDRVQTELAWSPDTITWERIAPGSPLIPLAEEPGSYDWGCIYAAATPISDGPVIRLYYGAGNGGHTAFRNGSFCLATLAQDRFAGYSPKANRQPAVVTTAAVPWRGPSLVLTAEAPDGEIHVTVRSQRGKLLCFGRQNSRQFGSPVKLEAGETVRGNEQRPRLGEPVRITFQIRGATLYSFATTFT